MLQHFQSKTFGVRCQQILQDFKDHFYVVKVHLQLLKVPLLRRNRWSLISCKTTFTWQMEICKDFNFHYDQKLTADEIESISSGGIIAGHEINATPLARG